MAPHASASAADSGSGSGSGSPVSDLSLSGLSLSSRAVHADDNISVHRAIAPAMHVSTTFRYSDDPDQLLGWDNIDVSFSPLPTLYYSSGRVKCKRGMLSGYFTNQLSWR